MNALDEVIQIDFSKYWPNCANTHMKIRTIIWAAKRWGAPIEALPAEVQEKIKAARAENPEEKL